MPATTIDEVLARLRQIITESQNTGDRIGFFAALYYKVTDRVKQGIANGEFQDGPRMERLDVTFANRYLDALDAWRSGRPLTNAWKTAFEASRQSSLLVLQHLLLGINAHINLDLGIAAVETIGNGNLQDIHTDFNSINTIISSLTYMVLNEINQVSPMISLLGIHERRTESILIQFSIGNARDGAWCFAESIASLPQADRPAAIASRDKDIATLAKSLIKVRGLVRLTVWFIHLIEWKDPKKILIVLDEYKKAKITVRPTPPAPPH